MNFSQCPQCGSSYGPLVYYAKGGFRVHSEFLCGGHAKDRTKLLDHGSIAETLRRFLGLVPKRPSLTQKEEAFFNGRK